MKNRIKIKQNDWKSDYKILGNKNFSGFSIYLVNSIYNFFRREYNWENISKLENKLIKKITIITDTESTGRNIITMDGEIHSTDKNVVYFKVIICNPNKIVINKLNKKLQLKSFKKLNDNEAELTFKSKENKHYYIGKILNILNQENEIPNNVIKEIYQVLGKSKTFKKIENDINECITLAQGKSNPKNHEEKSSAIEKISQDSLKQIIEFAAPITFRKVKDKEKKLNIFANKVVNQVNKTRINRQSR